MNEPSLDYAGILETAMKTGPQRLQRFSTVGRYVECRIKLNTVDFHFLIQFLNLSMGKLFRFYFLKGPYGKRNKRFFSKTLTLLNQFYMNDHPMINKE